MPTIKVSQYRHYMNTKATMKANSDNINLTFSKQEARILQQILELFLDEKKEYLQDNKTIAIIACNMYRNIKDAREHGE
jgi:hypothetical protein